jgi:hypothetical protein
MDKEIQDSLSFFEELYKEKKIQLQELERKIDPEKLQ